MLGERVNPILENLALAPGCLPEPLGREPRGTVEGADEIREIIETDIESDAGDGAGILRQQAGRAAQPGTEQILMRCNAEHSIE